MSNNLNLEIPAEVREFAEKTVDQARKAFDSFVAAAQKATAQSEAAAESLTSMAVPREAAVQVWVGAAERPALLEQAEILSRAWGAKQIVVPDRHHFDVIEALEDAESDMVRWLAGLKQA